MAEQAHSDKWPRAVARMVKHLFELEMGTPAGRVNLVTLSIAGAAALVTIVLDRSVEIRASMSEGIVAIWGAAGGSMEEALGLPIGFGVACIVIVYVMDEARRYADRGTADDEGPSRL